jgi:hypothetical protein
MKFSFLLPVIFLCIHASSQSIKNNISSPDKKLTAQVWVANDKHAYYSVSVSGQPLLHNSRLGIIREDAGFSELSLVSVSPSATVTDKYETLNAKRSVNVYKANKRVYHFPGIQ